MNRRMSIITMLAIAFIAGAAQAGSAAPEGAGGVTFTIGLGGANEQISTAMKIFLLTTLLAFAPAIMTCVTSFTRIIIVLSFLRQALGTQNLPPNQVMGGIAIFLTLFTMSPTFSLIQKEAVNPCMDKQISEMEAVNRGVDILKGFMLRNTRESDLGTFYQIAKEAKPNNASEIPVRILVPSFMLSELKTAFQMGFLIFVPFLLIDLVISSVLMAMGMMMLPPMLISLPFKILIFIMVDGWQLVMGALSRSFS